MTDLYTEETRWIKIAAAKLATTYGVSYSLVLYRGEESYRRGDDAARTRQEMIDYCQSKAGHRVSHVQAGGTG